MSYVVDWMKDLAMGIPSIDAQHRELLERFDRFLDACAQAEARGIEEVHRLLEFLASYGDEHFAHEEKLMEERGYPLLEAHREKHQFFRAQLAGLRAFLDEPRSAIASLIHTRKFVLAWLVNHIKTDDQRMGEFLKGGDVARGA